MIQVAEAINSNTHSHLFHCYMNYMLRFLIAVNVLFPFVAFMVEDMGYSGSELGLYAGIPFLFLCFFLC